MIQLVIARSHGALSLSVSGMPARIFATLAAEWKPSASANRQPSRVASCVPTVVLPLPATPATITITARILSGPRGRGEIRAARGRNVGSVISVTRGPALLAIRTAGPTGSTRFR